MIARVPKLQRRTIRAWSTMFSLALDVDAINRLTERGYLKRLDAAGVELRIRREINKAFRAIKRKDTP